MFRIKGLVNAARRGRSKKQRPDRKERPYRLEPLEPRLLLSAELGIPPGDLEDPALCPAPVVENADRFNDDAVATAGDDLEAGTGPGKEDASPNKSDSALFLSNADTDQIRDTDKRQVAVVDPSVTDRDALVQALAGSREDARIFEPGDRPRQTEGASSDSLFDIYLLEEGKDGIEQVAEILGEYGDLDAVHVFSHGDAGSFRLGNTLVNQDELAGRSEQLNSWGNSLGGRGDILLYGCNVA
ncbi:MAG: DUF4347 domain-containing protein, partial [Desulfobacterales bacterium]|nr:DUF4347 domain-containing protein [Desulfobacterales bacterium]